MTVQTFVTTLFSDDSMSDLQWSLTITPPVEVGEDSRTIRVPVSAYEYYGRTMDQDQVAGRVARDQIERLYNVEGCHGYRNVYAPVGNGIVVTEVEFEVSA